MSTRQAFPAIDAFAAGMACEGCDRMFRRWVDRAGGYHDIGSLKLKWLRPDGEGARLAWLCRKCRRLARAA